MVSDAGEGLEIRPADALDTERILGLFAEHRFALQKREWLEWKYEKNPHGPARLFKVNAAQDLVGAVALLPRLFQYQGRSLYGIQGVDGLVRREARGKGVFNVMNRFIVTQELPGTGSDTFFFAFASVPASKRAMENAGWRAIGNFETHYCPLRPQRLGKTPAQRFAGKVAAAVWPLVRRALCHGASPEIEVDQIERFQHSADALFSKDMVHGERSADFMNWRVLDNPMDRMVAFVLRRRGRPAGHVVGKLRDRRLEIVELKLESPQGALVGALFKHLCEGNAVDAVEYFGLGPNGRVPAFARRCWRVRQHEGTMFAYHLERAGLPADPRLWDVTYLDSDW